LHAEVFLNLKENQDIPEKCNGTGTPEFALAMLSMERELVRNMPAYNERVIDHFEREKSKISV